MLVLEVSEMVLNVGGKVENWWVAWLAGPAQSEGGGCVVSFLLRGVRCVGLAVVLLGTLGFRPARQSRSTLFSQLV